MYTGTVTGYQLDGRVPFLAEIFLLSAVSRLGLKPTQPPIQWIPEALSSVEKRPGHEADHSPPPNADVKNVGAIRPLPHISS
jgi:hypothetical protein